MVIDIHASVMSEGEGRIIQMIREWVVDEGVTLVAALSDLNSDDFSRHFSFFDIFCVKREKEIGLSKKKRKLGSLRKFL